MSKIIERALTHKAVLIAEIGVNYYDIAKKMNISNMEAAEVNDQESQGCRNPCSKIPDL